MKKASLLNIAKDGILVFLHAELARASEKYQIVIFK
tara:strand:+ start:155 stop:262 length:108 start_codon:yes stop_codon:yes gene_type:complete